MTSEVLILNKKAVVIGADSAVTTSHGADHPRYSKSANKIFELTQQGSMAAAIYGTASIDGVPWELAIKLFRSHLAAGSFSRASDYAEALVSFLNANERLFPKALRDQREDAHFDAAIKEITRHIGSVDASILDPERDFEERRAAWSTQAGRLREQLISTGVSPPLSESALGALLEDLEVWTMRANDQIRETPEFAAFEGAELAELGHRLRYAVPHILLPRTGLVVAGYGEDQIFPAYEQLEVFGHVGDELFYRSKNKFEVTHSGIAMIQPLAQTSMIDAFTDGFGRSLEDIIETQSRIAFSQVFERLSDAGMPVPDDIRNGVSKACHEDFMVAWKRLNWQNNFSPLVDVLQSLSVQEMAHLAESLLGLDSLKERVTASSESVSGPIDVAAITKGEGLVWIRRKHYFDPAHNMRYAERLNRSFN